MDPRKSGMPSREEMEAMEERKSQMEEGRRMMLLQILDNDARERLSRISLVKPERARQVEDMIIKAAQSGRFSEKVTEAKLVSLLEQISEVAKPETKITFRRRGFDDEDDDF